MHPCLAELLARLPVDDLRTAGGGTAAVCSGTGGWPGGAPGGRSPGSASRSPADRAMPDIGTGACGGQLPMAAAAGTVGEPGATIQPTSGQAAGQGRGRAAKGRESEHHAAAGVLRDQGRRHPRTPVAGVAGRPGRHLEPGRRRGGVRRPRIITRPVALAFVSSFGALASFYLLLSVVPLYATSAGAGATEAGLVTGVLMLSTMAAELTAPRLMARFGYRLALGAGLLLLGYRP